MRILLWTWGLLLMAMAVVFFYSTSIVGDELVTEAEIRTRHQIEAIEWLIRDHSLFESEQDFAEWLDALAFKLNSRITYIVNGRVVADSEVPYADLGSLDDHGHRPEVLAALKEGWGVNVRHSDTLSKDMLYVARKFSGLSYMDGGILRMAVPFSHVSSRLDLLRTNLIWLFLGTFALAVILSVVMSHNMGRDIRAFSDLAKSIGEGDYSKRVRAVPGGEFKPLAESINAMAQSIEHNIELIRDQKGQLQAVFDGMREGVLTVDAHGRIESFNNSLDEMFNLPSSTIGRSPIEVIRRYEIQDLVEHVIADPDAGPRSIQIDIMDTRTVEVTAELFLDQNGVRKVILVFYDITEMKRSEKGLKDFVANASHQLRTPLTSIKGYTETLLDMPPDDPESARRFLETVLKNADHMDKVISSMLALAKSEQAGKLLKMTPLSGREHLSRAIDDLAVWASERDITFRTRTPDDEMMVMGETDGLLHVFHNLLNNAVKYSPDGGVITVSAEDDGESIVFCVEDQGPGISREHSTKVFERFYRVDENTIDGSGSAGLGLAICRRIVKNLGGEIWHDGYGEDVRGARFCFRLNKPEETVL
ncbi:HAMP domain-containing sensor histidine kinase [Desulfovibrio sp. Fe33]|uniref:HAMP domain-containing sensor histidine kinase n=1 Tax=Desulfovibrio sp. Fe33 TaxID=3020842 RepID=UPI00234C7EE7|nr:ATP-binding protein [Desulfovibrio sp. Fe33]